MRAAVLDAQRALGLASSAMASPNHSCMRAYRRAAVGPAPGGAPRGSHSSTHSIQSSRREPGSAAGTGRSSSAAGRPRGRARSSAARADVRRRARRSAQERLRRGRRVAARPSGSAGALAETPGLHGDPAIRTSSMPSRAISWTAASEDAGQHWRARRPGSPPIGRNLPGRARCDHPAAERARAFVDEILIPREVDAELRPPDGRRRSAVIRREALERGLSGGLHAPSTAGRAGRTSSGSSSRSSSGARRTPSPGTSDGLQRARPRVARSRSTAGCGRRCASCATRTP